MQLPQLLKVTEDYSAASFASLRSDLEAASLLKKDSETTGKLTLDEIIAVAEDRILPNIGPHKTVPNLTSTPQLHTENRYSPATIPQKSENRG